MCDRENRFYRILLTEGKRNEEGGKEGGRETERKARTVVCVYSPSTCEFPRLHSKFKPII